jgi:uroporphyrinogen decarboxylase
MTKFERIRAAIAGEPVDRVPFGLWYHFLDIPVEERAGKKLAKAELDFYRTYDTDFLKVMHDIPYDLPEGRQEIETLDEWKELEVIAPEEGNFGRQMTALRMIAAEVGKEVPVIDTVFNCLAYADKITGKKAMELLRESPADFHVGLGRIAETLSLWAEAIVKEGCAGIYFALQGASADVMSEKEYRQDFLPYDRQILERVENLGMFNVLHLHGENLHWKVWDSLPFHALCWSANLTPPSIGEARQHYTGCIMGGVNEVEIGKYTPGQVRTEICQAIKDAGERGLIIAPGCAVPTDCPPANLHAFKETVMEAR